MLCAKIQIVIHSQIGNFTTRSAHDIMSILCRKVLQIVLMTAYKNHIVVLINFIGNLSLHLLIHRIGYILNVSEEGSIKRINGAKNWYWDVKIAIEVT